MPINTDLLIAAPMLQDSFVDKDGLPMSGGVITCYQDNSRTTLKNWYYQSGSPGAYTYIRLPNPLTLSLAGTITDINGVDTIPFFYPYSELDDTVKQPYYITIVNHAQTNQITRQNFPFLPNEANEAGVGSQDNYIINNGFWRNIGTMDLTNVLDTVVAPSQHDTFREPDIHFIKNVTGGIDTVTFVKFPLTVLPPLTGDITPEFYLNHVCSNTPTGETQKCYQFPLSPHINVLASVVYTFTIQAQNMGGTSTGQNVMNVFLFQDTGTGTTAPAPTLIGSISLNSSWTKYDFTTIFPETAGLTLSNAGDDAWYIQVQMPLNISCDINFTRPSLYLTQTAPTNSFLTYDQIDTVINSWRTGDIRTTMNDFYYFGWVPMNDGTIGNSTSAASARANVDTWPLYNFLWSKFSPYGVTNFPIYTSVGVLSSFGANAYADWNANKAIALNRMMGRVMQGDVPPAAAIQSTSVVTTFKSIFNASSSGGLLITTSAPIFSFIGMPIVFTQTGSALPTGIVVNTIYYITSDSSFTGNTFHVSTTYPNALAGTAIPYVDAGTGLNTVSLADQGTITGEYFHTQVAREVGVHNHPGLTGNFLVNSAGDHFDAGPGAFNFTSNATTGNNTGGAPFNIIQAGVLCNMFIKL